MNYLILREIGMISRCFQSISDIEFKKINLEKGQYLFLVRIVENPGINQETLTDILKVDKTTTAKAVKKLIEKGYTFKKQNQVDKRIFNLYPEEKASKVYSFLKKEEEYSTKIALNNFNESETETIYKLLKKMRNNIEKDWKNVKKGDSRKYLEDE